MAAGTSHHSPPTWRQLQADTAPWAERLQFEFFREASAERKLRAMARLNRMARSLAVEGLRGRYPHASPAEIRRRLADLLLGPELAARVYGPLVTAGDKAGDRG